MYTNKVNNNLSPQTVENHIKHDIRNPVSGLRQSRRVSDCTV